MRGRGAGWIIALTTSLAVGLAGSPATAEKAVDTPAWFEGRLIDLADDWEGAKACAVGADTPRCFRTVAELEAFEAPKHEAVADVQAAAATCPSSLRLHSGSFHSGAVVSLSKRWSWINLSAYGFDNATSSYRIGGCDSAFASGVGGGGSRYPGNTSANASATQMLSGWDDIVSSVYIG